MNYVFYKKVVKIQLIRPIISLNRYETFKLSQFWNIPVNRDRTNKLVIFRRNRIRSQILPILKFFFNPKIDQAFLKFIQEINLDKAYFNKQIKENENFIKIRRFPFKKHKINKIKKKNFFFIYRLIYRKKFIDKF